MKKSILLLIFAIGMIVNFSPGDPSVFTDDTSISYELNSLEPEAIGEIQSVISDQTALGEIQNAIAYQAAYGITSTPTLMTYSAYLTHDYAISQDAYQVKDEPHRIDYTPTRIDKHYDPGSCDNIIII